MAVVRVFITVEKWLLFIRSELSRATNVPPVILIVGPWAFGVLEGRQVARWLASRAEWRADVLRDRTLSLINFPQYLTSPVTLSIPLARQ